MSKHDYKTTKQEERWLKDMPMDVGRYCEQAFAERDHYKRAYEAEHKTLMAQAQLLLQITEELSAIRAAQPIQKTLA